MVKMYVTLPELYLAYRDCRRHKRNKAAPTEFEMNLEENLYNLWYDLNNGTYTIGKSITFVVTKPKYREVFAADFRDRIVHHLLIRKLEPYFESYFVADAYACRKRKGTQYGVNSIANKINSITNTYTLDAWILKVDIKSFFMHIDKEVLVTGLELFMRDKCSEWENLDWWIDLAKKIIRNRPEFNCEKRGWVNLWDKLPKDKSLFYSNGLGLPIGNLTSQFFANFYLTKLDKYLETIPGLTFGRYADDTILIHLDKQVLLDLLPKIRELLKEELHLELHPDKVYLQKASKGCVAFGTIIANKGRLYPGKRAIGNAFKVVYDERVKFLNHHSKELLKFISRINSYFGYYRHLNSFKIREKLVNLINTTEFKLYIYYTKGFKCVKLKEEYKFKNKLLILRKYDLSYNSSI